jgi:hypothetical protein
MKNPVRVLKCRIASVSIASCFASRKVDRGRPRSHIGWRVQQK